MSGKINNALRLAAIGVEHRKQSVLEELRRDPSRSNRALARQLHMGSETIAKVRRQAIDQGIIPADAPRRDDEGRAYPMPRPRHVLAKEIRDMLGDGHNFAQTADALGIKEQHVRRIAHAHGIRTVVARSGPKFSSEKIVIETVHILAGVTQGLEMAHHNGLDLDQEQAKSLSHELRPAMRAARWLESRLKELSK